MGYLCLKLFFFSPKRQIDEVVVCWAMTHSFSSALVGSGFDSDGIVGHCGRQTRFLDFVTLTLDLQLFRRGRARVEQQVKKK